VQPEDPFWAVSKLQINTGAIATVRSGVLLHHPRFLSGLPFAGSLCSGYSHLERQLFTNRVYLQCVALLDVPSQKLFGQRGQRRVRSWWS
jgi:hypothetical protein